MELKTIQLTKQYGSKIAVDHLNITLSNCVYGLLGANGAGKTTYALALRYSNPHLWENHFGRKKYICSWGEIQKFVGVFAAALWILPGLYSMGLSHVCCTLKGLGEKQAKKKSRRIIRGGWFDRGNATTKSELFPAV